MLKKFSSTSLDAIWSSHFAVFLLRVTSSLFMLTHGFPKIMKVLNGNMGFGDPLGLGPGFSLVLSAFAEGICSLFLLLGWKTRLAAIPLIINMAVAGFLAHAGDPFAKKELALIYLVIFVVLFIVGAGKYSLDRVTNS
jgi:putative oxidoreductase